MAASFDFRDENDNSLSDVARLDTMVTVVDAVYLLKDFSSHDFLRDEDDRSLVSLLTEQIEFAYVIILNKCPDAGPERVDAARRFIGALNADAQIIETTHSDVPADAILDTGRFDFDHAHEHPMWADELYGFANHTPETEEYGVASFVYHARAPFHPARIHEALNGPLPGVIRAKGHFWMATRPDCQALTRLLATLPPEQLPETRQILRPDAIGPAVARLCARLPDCAERQVFIASITTLAEAFADALRAPWLRLRLEVVTGDACRKFHVDNVTVRLVCTYRGTGTQYGLAPRGEEPEVIHTVATGPPIVLRGRRWPTTPPSLLRHRSPPIAGTGEARLLLVLDPILDPENEV